MYGITNAGGGSGTKSTLIISIDSGSTVEVFSNSTYTTLIKTATEKSAGQFWVKGLDNGTYYLKATKSGQTTTMAYTISEYGVYRITMAYRTIPAFTYTGSYAVVKDDNTTISDISTYNEANWKIRFLTSGTLKISTLYGAANGIDVFLVGAGGSKPSGDYKGGAGGGYTKTYRGQSVAVNTNYSVTVGQPTGTDGGSSKFGSLTAANGGKASQSQNGGNGGSGGGGGRSANGTAGKGGSNGGNGVAANGTGGTGQGTTTREFGESSGMLYAGGGGGISDDATGSNGWSGSATNFGHGAHGGRMGSAAASGGSGIVIIRNARS